MNTDCWHVEQLGEHEVIGGVVRTTKPLILRQCSPHVSISQSNMAIKDAVRNLIAVADSLAAAVEQEFGTMAPDDPYYVALAAVRKELEL